jgi:hypothetical protein
MLNYSGPGFTQDAVDEVMKEPTFNAFQEHFYIGPHAAIHNGIGGESK